MAPYSMDLRERVARAFDASGDADEVAATFGVSRAWVHRLIQRRRETGSLATADADEVSVARHGRPETAPGGADHGPARSDVGGTARRRAHHGGHQHGVVRGRSTGLDG
jgi:transposase